MSTDREFVDDRHEPASDPDPYGIVPDDFVAVWNSQTEQTITTIAEALRVAEQAPSTTPRSEMDRCPAKGCGSVKLRYKPGEEQSNSREGVYQCVRCKAHISNPLPPVSAFGADMPICPSCRSWRLRKLVGGDVSCLDCGETHAAAADGVRENGQLSLGEVAKDD